MRKLRIGVIGLGRVAAKTHIPVLKSLPGLEVVAGAELSAERGERVRKMHGLAAVYTDYREMLAAGGLDGVYVCLPNHLHREACEAALRSGVHVLCEKPVGISVAEALALQAATEETGRVLMPGYKKRYAENFAAARGMVAGGLLGDVIHVQGVFMTPGPYISWDPKSDWYLDPRWKGVVYDIACHLVDLLLYVVPCEVTEVRSLATAGFRGYPTPTNVAGAFRAAGGIVGDVAVGWRAATDVIALSVHGTAGSLVVSRDFLEHYHPGTDPVDRIAIQARNMARLSRSLLQKVAAKISGREFYEEDLRQAAAFCNAVRGEAPPPIGMREAVAIHRFLEMLSGHGAEPGGQPEVPPA